MHGTQDMALIFDDVYDDDAGERARRMDGRGRGRRTRDSVRRRPAFTTIEEIAHADALRLQLRARLLRDAPPARPWCVGVE